MDEDRIAKIPTLWQFIAIVLTGLGLMGGVIGAVYATSQSRLLACEVSANESKQATAVVLESLKRIESSQDWLKEYILRMEEKEEARLNSLDQRLRYVESKVLN